MKGHSYDAEIVWKASGEFAKGRYSRAHVWRFDGGVEVPASASPSVVRVPYSLEEAVDPEEALVAALSSCHMLTFLDIARHAGLMIEAYEDKAVGVMGDLGDRRYWVEKVILRPMITFKGDALPDAALLQELHEKSHKICFIANSVKTEIEIAPEPSKLVAG
ncbi:OsmC family protein [Roseibium sp.]|uniref:OsmC family protein n=1 Tax=Roseibium sp. TaxID=1936156 RepID=UPI003A972463